jgi:anaerobic selenocysteine-containing dehydrogenase
MGEISPSQSGDADNIFKGHTLSNQNTERFDMVVRTLPVACPLDCGGCPLLAHIEDGKVVRITNNPNGDPHMAGFIKGLQMTRVLYAPTGL